MIITFLGTGTSQGIPVIACDCDVCQSIDFRDKRTRTSIHIEVDGKSLVVDTGPDFRSQMLRERIKHLDAVLFTHAHKDHTAGMDDVRSFNFKQQMDMPVYARKEVIQQLEKEYSYVFAEHKYPGVPQVETHEITNEAFEIAGTRILPIEVMHYKLPVFGFRIQDFTYITDANFIADEELEKIKGTRVLVLNALQKENHISHFTLEEAIQLAQKIGAEQTYFIHMSHKMGKQREVEQELPEGIDFAFDGLKVEL
ncbi:MBL fold metallo-hydrolase [Marinoscillum sp.]|uniref:MBL fold metallo-hydrolase n=1 Tax=Marinoscillum sp. TaxID=2024838 RepID=UPI003BAA29A9